jgi:hypothetical protein
MLPRGLRRGRNPYEGFTQGIPTLRVSPAVPFARRRSQLLPWLIVLVAALAYPVAVLAGGSPHFPRRSDCVHRVRGEGNLEVVFGRFAKETDAKALLQRALGAGFTLAQAQGDGCGLVKVFVPGIPTVAVGRDLIAEARPVGLKGTLEQGQP